MSVFLTVAYLQIVCSPKVKAINCLSTSQVPVNGDYGLRSLDIHPTGVLPHHLNCLSTKSSLRCILQEPRHWINGFFPLQSFYNCCILQCVKAFNAGARSFEKPFVKSFFKDLRGSFIYLSHGTYLTLNVNVPSDNTFPT